MNTIDTFESFWETQCRSLPVEEPKELARALYERLRAELETVRRERDAAWRNRDLFCAHINNIAKAVGMNVENASPEATERNVLAALSELTAAQQEAARLRSALTELRPLIIGRVVADSRPFEIIDAALAQQPDAQKEVQP
jgi:hypothetical protein